MSPAWAAARRRQCSFETRAHEHEQLQGTVRSSSSGQQHRCANQSEQMHARALEQHQQAWAGIWSGSGPLVKQRRRRQHPPDTWSNTFVIFLIATFSPAARDSSRKQVCIMAGDGVRGEPAAGPPCCRHRIHAHAFMHAHDTVCRDPARCRRTAPHGSMHVLQQSSSSSSRAGGPCTHAPHP